jgi:hypothetical protein
MLIPLRLNTIAIAAMLSGCSADTNRPVDPLADFTAQLDATGRPPTPEEWCRLSFLIMASPHSNEQLRIAVRETARNRGCYGAPQAQPSVPATATAFDEQARIALCRTIPTLLSQPDMSNAQKFEAMKMAKANGCVE